jgi:hypothetical protein
MTSPAKPPYLITATPTILERVYYAIKRVSDKPDLTAQKVNREIAAQFGSPLAATHWTIINAARRAGALNQIVTRSFDFADHGRKARTGKSRAALASSPSPAKPRRPRKPRRRKGSSLAPDNRRHSAFLISIWKGGKLTHTGCATRRAARTTVAKALAAGTSVSDIAVYSGSAIAFRFSLP